MDKTQLAYEMYDYGEPHLHPSRAAISSTESRVGMNVATPPIRNTVC